MDNDTYLRDNPTMAVCVTPNGLFFGSLASCPGAEHVTFPERMARGGFRRIDDRFYVSDQLPCTPKAQ
jgi:hypothetical protein